MSSFGDGAARLCHAAAVLLGWRPDDFWNATPAELSLTLRPPGDGGEAIDRVTIDALKQRFPDQVKA